MQPSPDDGQLSATTSLIGGVVAGNATDDQVVPPSSVASMAGWL
jgi:hypothetical protein